jgi:hypothetical protein|tara:strand:+ start:376 stop:621 length:246 start_codon:yes stop_codon:yes gene_type:complete
MSVTVEFVLIDDMEMPPIVIAMDRQNQPKVTLNNYYREWLGIHRKVFGGMGEGLYNKIDQLIDNMLQEGWEYKQMDREDFE